MVCIIEKNLENAKFAQFRQLLTWKHIYNFLPKSCSSIKLLLTWGIISNSTELCGAGKRSSDSLRDRTPTWDPALQYVRYEMRYNINDIILRRKVPIYWISSSSPNTKYILVSDRIGEKIKQVLSPAMKWNVCQAHVRKLLRLRTSPPVLWPSFDHLTKMKM